MKRRPEADSQRKGKEGKKKRRRNTLQENRAMDEKIENLKK
jgi:hypothetical protein